MCILHFILKFKLHMYNRIEDFMLTIGWWQNYQSQSKKFRSDERVYNLKEYVRCGVLARIGLHHSLLSATDKRLVRLRELLTVTEEGL